MVLKHPSKKLGQNFLINKEICKKIINSITFSDFTHILEVGPGEGALTKYLVKQKQEITCVEIDKRLAEYIRKHFPKVKTIQEDILKINLTTLFNKKEKVFILTNLPYSISSPFIFWFIKQNISKNLLIMVQKEFAKRLEGADRGVLSIIAEEYFEKTTKIIEVSKNNFNPKPKVDSIVLSIQKNNKQYDQQFVGFVQKCFKQKRKTLFNNLKPFIGEDKIKRIFTLYQIKKNERAEQINKETFSKIFNNLKNEI